MQSTPTQGDIVETKVSRLLMLTNSKGRILFSVQDDSKRDGLYLYRADGSSGNQDKSGLLRAAWVVKCDNPSAKASGEWAQEFDTMPPLW